MYLPYKIISHSFLCYEESYLYNLFDLICLQFRKMTQLYLIFKELQDLQKSMPPAEANNDLLNTLKVRNKMHCLLHPYYADNHH